MDQKQQHPNYYAIIPADVRYDADLPPLAKLLYGELTALCDSRGFCWASNRYFADLFKVTETTIQNHIGSLVKRGYIRREVVRDERNTVIERRLYAGTFVVIPSPKKLGEGSLRKFGEPPQENLGYINPSNNDPSNNPPKAPRRGRARREPKKQPDHKPERFAAFWDYYPRGESKQAAIAAWDKLQLDDETIDIMAAALKRQMESEDWQRGIGIPYASTYLNGRRWEDEKKAPLDTPAQHGRRREKWG